MLQSKMTFGINANTCYWPEVLTLEESFSQLSTALKWTTSARCAQTWHEAVLPYLVIRTAEHAGQLGQGHWDNCMHPQFFTAFHSR